MDDELYIPMGVKPDTELFSGFGKRELMQSIIGSLCGGVIATLIYLISQNVTYSVVAILAFIVGSVMMTTKDQSNMSVVDQVQNMLRFKRSQKIYPYRYGDEWGLN